MCVDIALNQSSISASFGILSQNCPKNSARKSVFSWISTWQTVHRRWLRTWTTNWTNENSIAWYTFLRGLLFDHLALWKSPNEREWWNLRPQYSMCMNCWILRQNNLCLKKMAHSCAWFVLQKNVCTHSNRYQVTALSVDFSPALCRNFFLLDAMKSSPVTISA